MDIKHFATSILNMILLTSFARCFCQWIQRFLRGLCQRCLRLLRNRACRTRCCRDGESQKVAPKSSETSVLPNRPLLHYQPPPRRPQCTLHRFTSPRQWRSCRCWCRRSGKSLCHLDRRRKNRCPAQHSQRGGPSLVCQRRELMRLRVQPDAPGTSVD